MGKIQFIKRKQRPTPSYAGGGEVEQKIKDKLSKGAFELPMELIVYVPSTKQGNQIIPKSELQQRVKAVKTYLSNLFGGFSAAPIDGGYVSEDKNKGLIEEDAVKVTAFATKEALESNMDALLAKVKKWCAQWSQESIGLEFEGDLFYVSKTAKFNGGGQTEEEENRAMILSQAKEVSHHVSELNEIMTKQPDIDAWVIAKMQDVTTGLSDITHYLDGRVGFRLGADDVSERMKEMLRDGGEIILGGGSTASVQDSILARGAKLKSTRLTLAKLRQMIDEYNSEGRNFELRGAYNQLELWSNGNRIETGSKEDIYHSLIRYRYNPKYSDGAELPDLDSMTDEEIITFANTLSYYDRMDEGIEEEFDNVEDAKEYLRMMAESE